MNFTRREMMVASAAGALLPTAACGADVSGMLASPEAFGAVGDGVADDYPAFQRMVAAVNMARSGTVVLSPGRNYFLGRVVTANNAISDILFRGCSGLVIEGNGATISTKGDYFRDVRATRGLCGLRFEDCSNVQLRDVQLVGNVHQTTRAPGLAEAPSHGLFFSGCSDVVIDRVLARHFPTDGMYIRESAQADPSGRHRASRRFTVSNSRFLFNARQGLSVIQLRDATFNSCEFSYTGYVDESSASGRYGFHAPASGIDVEPSSLPTSARPVDVLTGNIAFRSCRMIGNYGTALTAAELLTGTPAMDTVTLDGCTLQASPASPLRYGLIFDVPGGAITNSTLELGDKTAFIGWNPQSSASPTFSGNTVSGTGTGLSHALVIVRKTRGSPVIEGNRLVVEGAAMRGGRAAQLVQSDNPNARIRDNQILGQQ